MDLLHADNSIIYLWDEATHTVMPRAWCNIGEWIGDVRLRPGEGVVGTVAQRREGMIVNEYQQSSYALQAHVPYLRQFAIVAEPLLYHDRLVGVLFVAHAQPGRHFTPQDRELLAVLAAQAAVTIENARLFEESAQRQAWLSSILEMNKRIAMSEDMPSLLSRIATEAARLVGAEGANFCVLHGDRLVTTRQTQYGLVLPDVPALQLGESIAGLAARDNSILVVPDLQAHPDVPAFIKAQAAEVGLHSMVSIPIRSRNNVIGVLSVNSARPRVFTEDESAALAICAEQVAIAIEHARLLAAEEERTAVLERTNLILRNEITERQRVEAERERLIAEQEAKSAEMERFTYTVSHDLKSPLITICGFLYGFWLERIHTSAILLSPPIQRRRLG
jgi:GAF domain-containing protein